ncbi:MAG TPA: SDR family NAD(P)-dependent oxidoreductase [Jiangellaceae bacterium]|nr:SDR family NAD(P)-dependent oxidoreductase [Jiangellaceae bacterium]
MAGPGTRSSPAEQAIRVPKPVRALLGLVWSPPDEAALRVAVDGRVVLVTGASRGIGAASARKLAAAGATVLLVARSTEGLDDVGAAIAADGGAADVYPADLADPAAVARLVDRVRSDHGPVDVVVSNAGKSIRRSVVESYDRLHDVTRTANVNYLGPVQLLLGLLPDMRSRGTGHVVSVGTVSTDLPAPYWAAYTGSKSAFEAWLRCIAPEIRADGVLTTSIHCPLVHTDMSAPVPLYRRLPGMTPQEAADAVCRAIAYRPRLMSPWWARAGGIVAGLAPAPTEALLTLYYRGQRSERLRAAGRGGARAARRITALTTGGGDRS